ncbi:response regulator [Desulfovibrio sp. JC010]|uniref:response regulator n=1 Tax=Desulfovibrio sp. JC010 TaxID=2593641 RepID=UPI0013D47A60|nr:response regulator [Desulfovibrio sp. JC010]NDV27827.1 response regulator [Desulfovibrio sp. JC010]
MMDATILFVDDEVGFVDAMSKRLARRNMTIHTAYDGDQAMKSLGEHPGIEVVILDMKMPGKDGLEVLRDIKRDHPIVEVIMLTGHATVESAIEGMQNGAFDYLMKPCNIDDLTEKIRMAVKLYHDHEDEEVQARIDDITHRMA